ncbi:hypothetical protein HYY70_06275 [Candidatus Woesearchaeota archaeon]|nr:hypothetical protein [Candidatus Woesearchaeota archaeon]
MHDVMVPCKKCGNKFPSYSLKLDLDEKMVICPECIKNKKLHTEIQEEVFHKQALKAPVINKPVIEQKSNKIAHKCTSCGYKFKIDSETGKPKNCPYCNARVMGY